MCSGHSEMDTLANSEDPDEMFQDVVFHQGLHHLVFPKAKSIIRERNTVLFGNTIQYKKFIS